MGVTAFNEAFAGLRAIPGQLTWRCSPAEQQDFATAIEQFCAGIAPPGAARALTEGGTLSNSPGLLLRLAELGWLGSHFPPSTAAAGTGMVEECIFLERPHAGRRPSTPTEPG